jgi:diguanylate cyclase (GGDEF)-like protein
MTRHELTLPEEIDLRTTVAGGAARTMELLRQRGVGDWTFENPGPLEPLLDAAFAAERRAERAERRAFVERNLSRTDALTGLLNARGWEEFLGRESARCQRHRYSASIVVIDLDDLKQVNDSRGHLAGDLLLKLVANVLRAALRRGDVVARIGGDEFAILAVGEDPPDIDRVVRRLQMALDDAGVQASVGAALHHPDDDIVESFNAADRSMYAVKQRRKVSRG